LLQSEKRVNILSVGWQDLTPIDQLLNYTKNHSIEIKAKHPFISVYSYIISNYTKEKKYRL